MDPQLLLFLKELDGVATHRIRVVAMGGNVLVSLGLRKSTFDVDINVRSEDEPFARKAAQNFLIRYGIPSHVLTDGSFITFMIPDYWERATPYETEFKNIELRLLNMNDILLCKIDWNDRKDKEHIEAIMSNFKVDVTDLTSRFNMYLQVYRYEDRKQEFMQNWEAFCKKYGIS